MSFYLFLDSKKDPDTGWYKFHGPDLVSDPEAVKIISWAVSRTSQEAATLVMLCGKMPDAMSLPGWLGEGADFMPFLSWLINDFWDGKSRPPKFRGHPDWRSGCETTDTMYKWWMWWMKFKYHYNGHLSAPFTVDSIDLYNT